jgi:hypothetical protein
MIFIKTTDAVSALRRLGVELSQEQLKTAIVRAINRTLQRGRTIARKEIKKVYNISQKNLEGVDYKRATVGTLKGELVADKKPIPLDAFAPKQLTATSTISISRKGAVKTKSLRRARKNFNGGISIEVKRGERENIPYAFLIPGGAVRVFARGQYRDGTQHGFIQRHHRVNKSGSDTPVKPLITVSEFGSILNPDVMKEIKKEILKIYPQRLDHEILFMVQKAAGSANNQIT